VPGKSVAALRCGFASQLESNPPPSPLFSRISSLQIAVRVPEKSCAVISHCVPIQMNVLLSKQRAASSASPPAHPLQATELCHRACLPYLSCCRVLVHLIDKNTNRHQYRRLRLPRLAPSRRPLTCQLYCTVSEHPLPSSLRSDTRKPPCLAGLWAS